MHQLPIIANKPTIAEVRALVREEGSSLLDQATAEQIDNAIRRDIGRPAVTATLLAGAAANWCEFEVLVDRLCGTVATPPCSTTSPPTAGRGERFSLRRALKSEAAHLRKDV